MMGGITTGGVTTGGVTTGGVTTGGFTTFPVRFTVMELSGLTKTDAGVGFIVNVNVPPDGLGVGVMTGGVTTGGVTIGGMITGGITTGGVTTGAELPCMIACIPRVMAISLCPQNL